MVPNLINVGERKLLSSSLETFNKKIACMKAGNLDGVAGITEEDEIPAGYADDSGIQQDITTSFLHRINKLHP